MSAYCKYVYGNSIPTELNETQMTPWTPTSNIAAHLTAASVASAVPMSRSSLQEWSLPARWRLPAATPCPPSTMARRRRRRPLNRSERSATWHPRSRCRTAPTLWTTGTAAADIYIPFTCRSKSCRLSEPGRLTITLQPVNVFKFINQLNESSSCV